MKMPDIDFSAGNFDSENSPPNPAFTLTNIYQIKEKQNVLDNINLQIEAGKITALVGPSGAGKTSLLRLLNRLDEPAGGRIFFRSLPLIEYPVQALRRRVGFVFQTPVMFPGTVADNLRKALELNGESAVDFEKRITETLALAELDFSIALREGEKLSVGQKQRVNLARALMTAPEVLLLDEPTSALDPQTADKLMDTVKLLGQEKKLTVVMVTHRLSEARRICDTTIFMENGRVVETGATEEIFERSANEKISRFLKSGK